MPTSNFSNGSEVPMICPGQAWEWFACCSPARVLNDKTNAEVAPVESSRALLGMSMCQTKSCDWPDLEADTSRRAC